MNRNNMTAVALAFLIALSSASANEASIPSGITVSPMFGQSLFDASRNMENERLFSLGLGFQFDNPWAIELTYLLVESDFQGSGAGVDMDQTRLDVLYGFDRNNNLQPYMAFGFGESDFSSRSKKNDETIVNMGGGLKYFFTTKLSWRADVRVVNSFDEEDIGLAYSLGLQYTFGKSKTVSLKKRYMTAPVGAAY